MRGLAVAWSGRVRWLRRTGGGLDLADPHLGRFPAALLVFVLILATVASGVVAVIAFSSDAQAKPKFTCLTPEAELRILDLQTLIKDDQEYLIPLQEDVDAADKAYISALVDETKAKESHVEDLQPAIDATAAAYAKFKTAIQKVTKVKNEIFVAERELSELLKLPPCKEKKGGTIPNPPTEQVAFGDGPSTVNVSFEGGGFTQFSTFRVVEADSGSLGGIPVPVGPDLIHPVWSGAGGAGGVIGVSGSAELMILVQPNLLPPPAPAYAAEDKPASGFPAVLPIKAPPKAPVLPSLPPRLTFNVEASAYAFLGGNSTLNGIPGGPGITPTGSDSFNFRDDFMFTTGGAFVYGAPSSWTAAVTGGFVGLVEHVSFNCATYCVNGVPVPTFSASKEMFLPGAYVGGRVQLPFAVPGLPGARFFLQYKHIFTFNENVSLGSVAQGRIVNFTTAPNLNLITAGLSIPLH